MAGQGMNRVVVTGNLTQDPELRHTNSGVAIAEGRVAVNGREKRGGEWQDRADFFDFIVWGDRGESFAEHMSKGSPVAVDGRLRHERWETQEGGKRSRVLIVADRVQFLPTGQGGGGNRRESDFEPPVDGGRYSDEAQEQPAGGAYAGAPAGASAQDDDDIPF